MKPIQKTPPSAAAKKQREPFRTRKELDAEKAQLERAAGKPARRSVGFPTRAVLLRQIEGLRASLKSLSQSEAPPRAVAKQAAATSRKAAAAFTRQPQRTAAELMALPPSAKWRMGETPSGKAEIKAAYSTTIPGAERKAFRDSFSNTFSNKSTS